MHVVPQLSFRKAVHSLELLILIQSQVFLEVFTLCSALWMNGAFVTDFANTSHLHVAVFCTELFFLQQYTKIFNATECSNRNW